MNRQSRIGNHDWYREGAAELLWRKGDADHWSGQGAEGDDTVSTAFALLFLSGADAVAPKKPEPTPRAEAKPIEVRQLPNGPRPDRPALTSLPSSVTISS